MIDLYNQSKDAEERVSLERPEHLKSVLMANGLNS